MRSSNRRRDRPGCSIPIDRRIVVSRTPIRRRKFLRKPGMGHGRRMARQRFRATEADASLISEVR